MAGRMRRTASAGATAAWRSALSGRAAAFRQRRLRFLGESFSFGAVAVARRARRRFPVLQHCRRASAALPFAERAPARLPWPPRRAAPFAVRHRGSAAFHFDPASTPRRSQALQEFSQRAT
ncbi:hypothetical protein, partial [Burkholderia oklahomensis]|uniref:hypothetical protein n=1 Tax=Burkholderia oklahomensis TaxID=342113 RepID=UPI001E2CB746